MSYIIGEDSKIYEKRKVNISITKEMLIELNNIKDEKTKQFKIKELVHKQVKLQKLVMNLFYEVEEFINKKLYHFQKLILDYDEKEFYKIVRNFKIYFKKIKIEDTSLKEYEFLRNYFDNKKKRIYELININSYQKRLENHKLLQKELIDFYYDNIKSITGTIEDEYFNIYYESEYDTNYDIRVTRRKVTEFKKKVISIKNNNKKNEC